MRRRGVGLMIGSVAILAGLGLAALTRAQPPVAKAPPADRAELRARVVKLRGEVEWLELEREAFTDRDRIKDFMKSIQSKKSMVEAATRAQTDPAMMAKSEEIPDDKVDAWYEKKIKEMGKEKRPGEDAHAALLRLINELCATAVKEQGVKQQPNEDAIAALRRSAIRRECGDSLDELDRLKDDFLRRLTALNKKRLELAEAEWQYNESR